MKLKDRKDKDITELYDMIQGEISKCIEIIQEKSGYYTCGTFLIFGDEPKKCMDIEMNIALLEDAHSPIESKVEYYAKVNPDNCMNKPVIAYAHNSWYKIYDGVHRKNANKLIGKEKIKVNLIVPKPEDINNE